MSIEQLLSDAFALGVGRSRRSALRSDRYRELVDTFPRVPYLPAEKSAEMALLGEQIADRAFLNLPVGLRRAALRWPQMDEDTRVALLKKVHKVLGEDSINYRTDESEARRNSPNRYLPHQGKSWSCNPALPNCLGLAQMLVGFGRATGAPILLINVLLSRHISVMQYQYVQFRRMRTLLEPYVAATPSLRRMCDVLDNVTIGTLRVLGESEANPQGHNALAIQTGSKWWVLDPYFRTLTTLDDTPVQLHRAEQFVTNNPHRVIAKRTRPLSQELNIEHRFQALEQCMPYLHQLHASRDEWDYSTTAFACLLNSYRPECSFDDDAIPESVLNDIEVNLAMSLCSTRTLDRFFALDKGDPERSISALVESKFDLASRNKRHRNQSLIRTVLLLVRKWYLSVLDIEQEDAPAKLQEYSHPTYHLAIQTTRQLAYDRKVDAADSCLYSSSQWVLHDSIDAVRKSGNKRYAQVHAQRIDKIRRHPSIALPQIRRFL